MGNQGGRMLKLRQAFVWLKSFNLWWNHVAIFTSPALIQKQIFSLWNLSKINFGYQSWLIAVIKAVKEPIMANTLEKPIMKAPKLKKKKKTTTTTTTTRQEFANQWGHVPIFPLPQAQCHWLRFKLSNPKWSGGPIFLDKVFHLQSFPFPLMKIRRGGRYGGWSGQSVLGPHGNLHF